MQKPSSGVGQPAAQSRVSLSESGDAAQTSVSSTFQNPPTLKPFGPNLTSPQAEIKSSNPTLPLASLLHRRSPPKNKTETYRSVAAPFAPTDCRTPGHDRFAYSFPKSAVPVVCGFQRHPSAIEFSSTLLQFANSLGGFASLPLRPLPGGRRLAASRSGVSDGAVFAPN